MHHPPSAAGIFKCSKPKEGATQPADPNTNAATTATPEKPKPQPAWTPCEAYSPAQCKGADECQLCTLQSGKRLCFHDDIAAKLPEREARLLLPGWLCRQ